MVDGKQVVEIPDEVIEGQTPLWEDFIIGKFLYIYGAAYC